MIINFFGIFPLDTFIWVGTFIWHYRVVGMGGVGLVGNAQDLAFTGVKFHFIFGFPSLEGVEIFLKDFVVFAGVDGAI